MNTIRVGNYKSLGVSLLLHAILLVLLTMYVIKPMVAPGWYEIELSPPATLDNQVAINSGPGAMQPLPQAATAQPSKAAESKAAAKPQPSQPAKTELTSKEPAPVKSDLLETPIVAPSKETSPKPQLNNPLNPLRGIPGVSGGRPGGTNLPGGAALPGGTVNYSLTGGKVSFQLPDGYKHSLGAGSVTVKFKLDKYARPVPGSIESMEQSSTRFYEEAVKILQQGSFKHTGSPNPGAVYSITINFVI